MNSIETGESKMPPHLICSSYYPLKGTVKYERRIKKVIEGLAHLCRLTLSTYDIHCVSELGCQILAIDIQWNDRFHNPLLEIVFAHTSSSFS
jgi:hypothetical protein